MKKSYFLKSLLAVLISTVSFTHLSAQTITAINNGDWNNPNTWNPVGVPYLEDSVIIDADVTISVLPLGVVCINSSALVIKQGKTLTNNYSQGMLIISADLVLISGNLVSNEPIILSANAENNGSITQTGNLSIGEAVYNSGSIDVTNDLIVGTVLTNQNTINVLGEIVVEELENNSVIHTNSLVASTGINNDKIQGVASIAIGDSFINNGAIDSDDRFVSGNNFNNYGFISTVGTATLGGSFTNHISGFMEIGDTLDNRSILSNNNEIITKHLLNSETITGTGGQFCISEKLLNYNLITGTIDVCDATPNTGSDINSGTISNSVTYCAVSPCASVTANTVNHNYVEVTIFPNPVHNAFQVWVGVQNGIFQLYDLAGQLVLERHIENGYTRISTNYLNSGVYIYTFKSDMKMTTGKLVFQ